MRRARWVVLLFFLTSGATGLVLEVTWARILGTVFGNTVYAASTVLTAFMLGLALGSVVLGPVADRTRRPLMLYGCLEVGVGLYALAFPALVAASCGVYSWFFRSVQPGLGLLNLVRFALSLLLLLPPTFLMGGTLPMLGRHLAVRRREAAQEVGYLYGTNTAGAVAGCFLAGFVLLAALGVRGSLWAAGAVALVVGLLAFALGRGAVQVEETKGRPERRRGRKAREAAEGEPIRGATFRLVLVAYGVAGFCALAYEVLWTRVLVFLLRASVYSFATMLTTFLAGLAAGSFLSARFLVRRVRRPVLWLGAIEVLVGLSVLVSVPALAWLEWIDAHLFGLFAWSGAWQAVFTRFADAFVVLFVPTLLMGAAFPMVTTACLRGRVPVGRRVGQVYAANTIGCVLGSFSAGFVLLPVLGTHTSLLALVALNLAVGVALIFVAGARSLRARLALATPVAALASAALLLTPSDVFYRTINAYHQPSRITFIEEHPTGTVTVHDLPNGDRLLAVGGVNVAGLDFMLRTTQKLQGYIPLCLHPSPRRVVQIGFGSGETARVGLEFGVEDYTVVEICPAVFDAGTHFESINRGSHRDPRIRRIIMDGKNFARLSDETFDIVMNDSTYPGSSGSSALYTVDHFRNCRKRLAPGGFLSCWVPLDLRPRELRMILKSFQSVFPHTSFWVASNCLNKHGLILGTLEPLRIDLARLQAVLRRPEVAADLRAIAIHDAYDLLDCLVCDEAAVRALVENDPLNSDDRPRLEFSCALRAPSMQSLAQVLGSLVECRTQVVTWLVDLPGGARDRAEFGRRFQATNHIFRGQVAQILGHPGARRREFDSALKANPGEVHVESCEEELRREIRDLQKAIADRPTNRTLALRLGHKLHVAGSRDAEAAAIYEKLMAQHPPPPPEAFVRLAEIRFRQRLVADAEDLLRRCLAAWPRSAEAHDRLAGVYLRTGRLDLARRHITEALRLAPGNPLYKKHQAAIVAAER